MYDEFWNDVLKNENSNFSSLKLVNESETGQKVSKNFKYESFKNEWIYVVELMDLLIEVKRNPNLFDWSTSRPGSFFIKSLNFFVRKGKFCDIHENQMFGLMKEIFKLPKIQTSYLPEITYLYSSMDFLQLTENSSHWNTPNPLLDIQESFVTCFKFVATSKQLYHTETDIFYDNQIKMEESFIDTSPCKDDEIPSECKNYCQWHQNVIEQMEKDDFLQIMKYGLPQRKLLLDESEKEFKLAKSIFGEENIIPKPNRIAPTSPIVFCYRKDVGYSGDDINMHAKLCNNFFPTPSDIGIVLTRNFHPKDVLKLNKSYEELFDISIKNEMSNSFIHGKIWSKTTLVFDTNANNRLSQTYLRKRFADRISIQFQIHQSSELTNFLMDNNHDDMSEPITLKRGNEYFIDVYPHGQIATDEFKALNMEQRKCKLEEEVDENNLFKRYNQKNCQYSCHTTIAAKNCGCMPWDFIGSTKMSECNVFGRSCFFNAMESITESPEELCPQCIPNCSYMKFRKVVTKRSNIELGGQGKYFSLNKGSPKGSKAFIDFLTDKNKTILDQAFRNAYGTFSTPTEFENDFAGANYGELIVVHLQFMQPEINTISPKYTIFDMIGNFGGQFGLFEQVTGATFLGIINLIIILLRLLFSSRRF